ncbi:FkbM family methyltransferase [Kordiimonas lacus]|uniref:Methyltransferase, FkbM family n=1 Tax=Kordiimonas lacus TaxID=637679 RepID=A0A1G6TUY3_9PROT|nr:FkbM family methyltransferase [Kordiimonas lacus]SDD32851.1 methyltransferase, FkbM family [Kordiimonas lacus]
MKFLEPLIRLQSLFASHPLTKDKVLKSWSRFISWQVRSRFKSELRETWINDLTVVVKRGMTGATGNIYVGLLEFPDMSFLLHFLRPGDLFVDIGSNVGSFTILASGVCGAKTYSFDPGTEAAIYLQKNVRANGLGSLVRFHNFALGSSNDEVSFTKGLGAVNRVNGKGAKVKVKQKTLDEVLAHEVPIFIKLDVEGYELAVLRGSKKTLRNNKLVAIQVETICPEILEMLNQHGFDQYYYDPISRKISEHSFNLEPANTLFIRDLKKAQCRVKAAEKVCVLGREI